MMRYVARLAMLSLATVSLAAQRDQIRPDDDQPVTIRGCLHDGRVLRANEPQHQTPSSRNWVTKGQRFALGGDLDLIEALEDHVRHEVEITGWLSVPDRAGVVAGPSIPRGRPPGLPSNPFARPPAAGPRITLSIKGDEVEDLVVTAYKHVSLNCLQ